MRKDNSSYGYTYINERRPVPENLHLDLLQSMLCEDGYDDHDSGDDDDDDQHHGRDFSAVSDDSAHLCRQLPPAADQWTSTNGAVIFPNVAILPPRCNPSYRFYSPHPPTTSCSSMFDVVIGSSYHSTVVIVRLPFRYTHCKALTIPTTDGIDGRPCEHTAASCFAAAADSSDGLV